MSNVPKTASPHAVGQTVLACDWLIGQRPRQGGDALRPLPHVRLWYPAEPASHPGSAWRRAWFFTRRKLYGGGADCALPERSVAHGESRFPVVLYHPGWPGTAVDNHILIEGLAARGYVVAALSYPAKLPHLSEAMIAKQRRDLEKPMDYSSEAAYLATLQSATQRVRTRAADGMALLDALARWDGRVDGDLGMGTPGRADKGPDAPADLSGIAAQLVRRLDLGRVGIMGFSLGGAIAAETSILDSRVRAVVNVDGRHWGTALETGVVQPYLIIGEELLQPSAEDLAAGNPDRRYNALLDRCDYSQLAKNLRRNGGIQVVIHGTQHLNFTDAALRRRLRKWPGTGTIDAARALEILGAYVLAFFEQSLRERPSPLLQPFAKPYPEASISVWQRPVAFDRWPPGRDACRAAP